jgi:hypothetical protein
VINLTHDHMMKVASLDCESVFLNNFLCEHYVVTI